MFNVAVVTKQHFSMLSKTYYFVKTEYTQGESPSATTAFDDSFS